MLSKILPAVCSLALLVTACAGISLSPTEPEAPPPTVGKPSEPSPRPAPTPQASKPPDPRLAAARDGDEQALAELLELVSADARQGAPIVSALLEFQEPRIKRAICGYFNRNGNRLFYNALEEALANRTPAEILPFLELDLQRLLETASQAPRRSLAREIFARHAATGRAEGLRALFSLAAGGDTQARLRAEGIMSYEVWRLRDDHLYGSRISGPRLRRSLYKISFGDDPLALYLAFISRDNFGELAAMIMAALKGESLRRAVSMIDLLLALDPARVFYRDFLMQAAGYSLLADLCQTPVALRRILDDLFLGLRPDEVLSWSYRLALFVENILLEQGFPYRAEFEQHLWQLYLKSEALCRHLIATLLVAYRHELSTVPAEKIELLKAQHGIMLEDQPIPYHRLLVDGKIPLHIVFTDRPHLAPSIEFFEQRGFQRVPDGQPNGVTRLENDLFRLNFIDAYVHPFALDEARGRLRIFILRSHQGEEKRILETHTNAAGNEINSVQMAIISSCRSATLAGRLASLFPQAAFVTAEEIAEGLKTNHITYAILQGLQVGIPTYGELSLFVRKQTDTSGYILPGAKSEQVMKEVQRAGRKLLL